MREDPKEHLRPARAPGPRLSAPESLLRAARGFSCVFWGIPLSLLLFSGALGLHLSPVFNIPTYVLGVVLVYAGVVFFHRAGRLTVAWPRRVGEAMIVMLLQVYLAPFVNWWRRLPHVPYYAFNVAILIVVTAWGLLVLNRLGGEVGRRFRDRSFCLESRVSGWFAGVLMLTPLVYAFLDTAGITALLPPRAAAESVSFLPVEMPAAVYGLTVIPFTLTMATAWRAKERCLHILRLAAKAPP